MVTDDATDYYMLNQGNGGGSGPVSFLTFSFNAGGGFGGNHAIADLDNDGFNDVIITDHDVDFFDCDSNRRTNLYRNLGGPAGRCP